MKTMVVISDTHGNKAFFGKLKPLFAENDYIVHLGDGANDMLEVYREYPDKVYVCNGNCDFYGSRIAMDEWNIDVEGHTVLMCHGHKYGVKASLDGLALKAKECGADIALYGHTHIAAQNEIGGVTLINPGALSYSSGAPSYCYIVFTKQKVVATIVPLA